MNSTAAVEAQPSKTATPLFPFLDLKAQFRSIRAEVLTAAERVLESQQLILGPDVARLEEEIGELVGCRYAIGCASGSDALLLALAVLGVGSGDEVITSPFTFVATAGSIARLGARPVFVDSDAETYNISPESVEAAITPRTKAIMPVHLFGLPAAMEEITRIAERHGLAVVEDAAQAIGATYQGRPIGSIGQIGCFSFFPSKNLGGAGDGGMVTTNDSTLAERLRTLRVHGNRIKYCSETLGVNSRLDSLQAAILRVKLRHLEDWTSARREHATLYRKLVAQAGLEELVCLPVEPSQSRCVYNQFVIRTSERDALRAHLTRSGIPTEIYYPLPLHLQPAFAYLGQSHGDFPNAESASREVLALPVFPEMTEIQQRTVVSAISDFFGGRA